MPAGIEVWDGAGVKRMSITDRIGVVLGYVYTNSVNGSINVPELANGTPFTFTIPLSFAPMSNTSVPISSVSGTTVSWTYTGVFGTPNKINAIVVYGVF